MKRMKRRNLYYPPFLILIVIFTLLLYFAILRIKFKKDDFLKEFSREAQDFTIFLPIILFSLFFVVWMLLRYLKSDRIRPDYYQLMKNRINSLEKTFDTVVWDKIENLKVSDEEKKVIINKLISEIKKDSNSYIIQNIESKFGEKIINERFFNRQVECSRVTIERISNEITNLSKRANLNLVIGILITIIAGVLLISIVYGSTIGSTDINAFLQKYIPRLTIIIFIELFAYFFLRLYKLNLEDIKFYQKEIINLELKYLSLFVASTLDKKSTLEKILETYSKTERNYVLKKDETTLDIEREKIETKHLESIVQALILKINNLKLK